MILPQKSLIIYHCSKIPNVNMSVTISTLCMFIYGDDVSYFETLFNHSKLCNLNTLLKMVKNTNKLCRGFFIRKNNKNKLKENG